MTDLAIITGATGALGIAVVDAFAKRGDRVLAVARSRADVSKLASAYPGVVIGDTADLTSRPSVDDLWERIDRIGTPRWVVNTVGGFRGGKLVESAPDDFTDMINLNLASAWWTCRAAARRMTSHTELPPPLAGEGRGEGVSGGGCIVNVAARAGLVSDSGATAYAVSKAGVIKLSELLAAELKASGVRVNVVAPAVIDTPSNRATMPEKLLQRAVPPSEIASVIAYLCSEDANGVTGAVIPVFGKF